MQSSPSNMERCILQLHRRVTVLSLRAHVLHVLVLSGTQDRCCPAVNITSFNFSQHRCLLPHCQVSSHLHLPALDRDTNMERGSLAPLLQPPGPFSHTTQDSAPHPHADTILMYFPFIRALELYITLIFSFPTKMPA